METKEKIDQGWDYVLMDAYDLSKKYYRIGPCVSHRRSDRPSLRSLSHILSSYSFYAEIIVRNQLILGTRNPCVETKDQKLPHSATPILSKHQKEKGSLLYEKGIMWIIVCSWLEHMKEKRKQEASPQWPKHIRIDRCIPFPVIGGLDAQKIRGAVVVFRVGDRSFWLDSRTMSCFFLSKALHLDVILSEAILPCRLGKYCVTDCPHNRAAYITRSSLVKRIPVEISNYYHILDITLDCSPVAFELLVWCVQNTCYRRCDSIFKFIRGLIRTGGRVRISHQLKLLIGELWGKAVIDALEQNCGSAYALMYSGVFMLGDLLLSNIEAVVPSVVPISPKSTDHVLKRCEWTKLPTVLFGKILSCLGGSDYSASASVCQTFYAISKEPCASPAVIKLRPYALRGYEEKRSLIVVSPKLVLYSFDNLSKCVRFPLFSKMRELVLSRCGKVDLTYLTEHAAPQLEHLTIQNRTYLEDQQASFIRRPRCNIRIPKGLSSLRQLKHLVFSPRLFLNDYLGTIHVKMGADPWAVLPLGLLSLKGVELGNVKCLPCRKLQVLHAKIAPSIDFPLLSAFPVISKLIYLKELRLSGLETWDVFGYLRSLVHLRSLSLTAFGPPAKGELDLSRLPVVSLLESLELVIRGGELLRSRTAEPACWVSADNRIIDCEYFHADLSLLSSLTHLKVSPTPLSVVSALESGCCPRLSNLHLTHFLPGSERRVVRPSFTHLHLSYAHSFAPVDFTAFLSPLRVLKEGYILTFSGQLTLAHYDCLSKLRQHCNLAVLQDQVKLRQTDHNQVDYPCQRALSDSMPNISTISGMLNVDRQRAHVVNGESSITEHLVRVLISVQLRPLDHPRAF